MSETPGSGLIVSIASVVSTALAFLAFWMKLSNRITVADRKARNANDKADDALQEAAEAKNDTRDLRDAFDDMSRRTHDQIERLSKEDGDSLNALRQHVTDLAMYMRDNFVRNTDFTAAMTKIEASQLRMDTKLDRIAEQTRPARPGH